MMYHAYYGFKERPFQLDPDPRYFCFSASHKKALVQLHYGLRQGEGIVAITGDRGCGKTMLVTVFALELANQDSRVAHITLSPAAGGRLICDAAKSLGVAVNDCDDRVDLLRLLEHELRESYRQGKQSYLLIDEAHCLSVAALNDLQLLTELNFNGTSLLQCFLFGQQGLRQIFTDPRSESIRDRVVAATNVNALTVQEVEDYVVRRLQMAGWQGYPAIDPNAFKAIHLFAQGIPLRINLLCDRVLAHACLLRTEVIGEAIVQDVALGPVASLAVRKEQMQRQAALKRAAKTRANKRVAALLSAGIVTGLAGVGLDQWYKPFAPAVVPASEEQLVLSEPRTVLNVVESKAFEPQRVSLAIGSAGNLPEPKVVRTVAAQAVVDVKANAVAIPAVAVLQPPDKQTLPVKPAPVPAVPKKVEEPVVPAADLKPLIIQISKISKQLEESPLSMWRSKTKSYRYYAGSVLTAEYLTETGELIVSGNEERRLHCRFSKQGRLNDKTSRSACGVLAKKLEQLLHLHRG